MRGRQSGLLPIELAILETGIAFRMEGIPAFHGFRASARIKEATESSLFTTHGALYKALDRLEKRGYLVSDWEDPAIALAEGRPRRRLYRVTPAGEAAVGEARRSAPAGLRKAPAQ
ncbi:MAG: PadR family transcriptional regulator [Tepidiformaceae bacterium]